MLDAGTTTTTTKKHELHLYCKISSFHLLDEIHHGAFRYSLIRFSFECFFQNLEQKQTSRDYGKSIWYAIYPPIHIELKLQSTIIMIDSVRGSMDMACVYVCVCVLHNHLLPFPLRLIRVFCVTKSEKSMLVC